MLSSHKTNDDKNKHIAIAYQTNLETLIIMYYKYTAWKIQSEHKIKYRRKKQKTKILILSTINTLPADPHTTR